MTCDIGVSGVHVLINIILNICSVGATDDIDMNKFANSKLVLIPIFYLYLLQYILDNMYIKG